MEKHNFYIHKYIWITRGEAVIALMLPGRCVRRNNLKKMKFLVANNSFWIFEFEKALTIDEGKFLNPFSKSILNAKWKTKYLVEGYMV